MGRRLRLHRKEGSDGTPLVQTGYSCGSEPGMQVSCVAPDWALALSPIAAAQTPVWSPLLPAGRHPIVVVAASFPAPWNPDMACVAPAPVTINPNQSCRWRGTDEFVARGRRGHGYVFDLGGRWDDRHRRVAVGSGSRGHHGAAPEKYHREGEDGQQLHGGLSDARVAWDVSNVSAWPSCPCKRL